MSAMGGKRTLADRGHERHLRKLNAPGDGGAVNAPAEWPFRLGDGSYQARPHSRWAFYSKAFLAKRELGGFSSPSGRNAKGRAFALSDPRLVTLCEFLMNGRHSRISSRLCEGPFSGRALTEILFVVPSHHAPQGLMRPVSTRRFAGTGNEPRPATYSQSPFAKQHKSNSFELATSVGRCNGPASLRNGGKQTRS